MPDKMPIAAAVPESFLDLIEIVTSTRTYRLRATVPEIEGAATPTDAASKPVVRTLRSEALRWTYVLRSRERWLGNASERDAREADAIDTLKAFGLTEADLVAITGGDRAVVVRMPFVAEAQGWEGRVFPWEYVIAAATRHYRKSIDQRVTVMREVIYPKRTVALPRTHHRPVRFLFVQSAPGELRDAWDFSGEQRRLKRVLPKEMRFEVLENPTPAELSARVTSAKPDVIHFSGFGNMQGLRELRKVTRTGSRVHVLDDREEAPAGAGVDDGIERDLLDLLDNERGVADGYLMSASDGSPLVVPFTRFAEIVKGKRTQPAYLVSLGIPNSAARIAPLLVGRESALAAVGFQDVIDDTFAEYFFELLYGGLRNSRWNLPRAFLDTWAYLRSDPEKKRPTGTGIALWAGAPLLEPGLGTVAKKIEYTGRMPKELDCDVESISELNYAVLHNRGQLFKRFTILKGRNTSPDAQIAVDVTAHLGMESASFSRQFPATIARWDLEKEVHIPLTASLARSVREAVNSTLVVEVREDQRVRFRNSYPLRLLPVDQWKDDENDGKWLPSFVQPRDPAVVKAIESAQRYVRVLRDDPSAGFEGYQAAPDATEDQLREVDLQVQAIWATLLHDWQLGYINPPPSYSEHLDSQRLRRPTTILESRSGTCIDLALLLASCLELVDIYPVIFLLDGHALPGYWRHNGFQESFRTLRQSDARTFISADQQSSSASGAQREGWQAGTGAYNEIMQRIRARELVPLETVRLTENCGFVEAIEAGIEALAVRADFYSMHDVVTARENKVTPLPITGEAV